MRVIAGEYRRRLLAAPAGAETRPTSDRLRETLFNVLAPRLSGAWFLDLFAGSGANGIEALSRGAAQVVFVESAPAAIAAIRKNLSALGVAAGRYRIEAQPTAKWLADTARPGAKPGRERGWDVVFLDPPYDLAGEYSSTLSLLGGAAADLLARGAVVIAEHRRERRIRGAEASFPAPHYGRLSRVRLLEQGDAALSFYAPAEDRSG